jgi:hypothetical protein
MLPANTAAGFQHLGMQRWSETRCPLCVLCWCCWRAGASSFLEHRTWFGMLSAIGLVTSFSSTLMFTALGSFFNRVSDPGEDPVSTLCVCVCVPCAVPYLVPVFTQHTPTAAASQ